MQDVIDKLEKASGPNFALEREIWLAANAPNADREHAGLSLKPPAYTQSIDAALTLFGDHLPRGLHLYRNSAPDMGGKDWVVSHQSPSARVAARSWPLAICIAALKARQR